MQGEGEEGRDPLRTEAKQNYNEFAHVPLLRSRCVWFCSDSVAFVIDSWDLYIGHSKTELIFVQILHCRIFRPKNFKP